MRPRSEKEIKERLLKKSYCEDTIREVLFFLKEQDFINDRKFAESWIRSRLALKPVSRYLLKRELRLKGIDEQTVQEAIDKEASGFDEQEEALKLALAKKRRFGDIEKEKSKKRIADFLKRRGFSTSVIYDTIGKLYDRTNEDPLV